MVDLKNLLPQPEAMLMYRDPKIHDSLDDDELRLLLQSVYFYDDALFAEDICVRWTSDHATGNRIPSAEFHREIWAQENKREDSLYIVARDHAKTTAVSKIRTMKELIYGIEKSVLLIMTKSLGEAVVGDVRKELESNDLIRWIYGSLVPNENRANAKSEKWRQRELQLLNGTQLKTITKGEAVRGLRPTKIRVDDPQEKKDVRNPIIADEFADWIFTAVYPALDPSGSMSVLATLISDNCFANKLKIESQARHFKVIEYPAILNFNEKEFTGTPLWPAKWSMADLKTRYEKIGGREFLQEYQNLPFTLNGSPVFDPAYTFKVMPVLKAVDSINYFRSLTNETIDPSGAKVVQKLFKGVIGLDLANGMVGGDYSAITVRAAEFKLLCQYRGYITQDRLAAVVDNIVAQMVDVVVIPENNSALAFLDACKKYPWHRKIYRQKTVDKITNKTSESLGFNTNAKTKPLIINALDQLFRVGDFEISEAELDEIKHYYYDERGGMNAIAPRHDDLLLSDAMTVQGLKRGFSNSPLMFI